MSPGKTLIEVNQERARGLAQREKDLRFQRDNPEPWQSRPLGLYLVSRYTRGSCTGMFLVDEVELTPKMIKEMEKCKKTRVIEGVNWTDAAKRMGDALHVRYTARAHK